MPETVAYTLLDTQYKRREIPAAEQVAPGLFLFRLPDEMSPDNPCRWRIGHHSGRSVADSMCQENAIRGAELLATLADWTQDVATLQAAIDRSELFIKLSFVDCVAPGSERMRGDVSNNGRYTDNDIREAAAEFKADGYNALEVLIAMAHSVPWMGLDTDEFNEAHNRVVKLSGAN